MSCTRWVDLIEMDLYLGLVWFGLVGIRCDRCATAGKAVVYWDVVITV